MTRKELHALMTGMVFNQYDHRLGTPMQCAHQALELLEAAEEVYAKSEGFRGTIEALEVAARGVVAAFEIVENSKTWTTPHALGIRIQDMRHALAELEPTAAKEFPE